MVGRHAVHVPNARQRRPWYVVGLPLIPLAVIVFVLAGWWDHYKLVPIGLGLVFATLSLWMQHRRTRLDRRERGHP